MEDALLMDKDESSENKGHPKKMMNSLRERESNDYEDKEESKIEGEVDFEGELISDLSELRKTEREN